MDVHGLDKAAECNVLSILWDALGAMQRSVLLWSFLREI